MALYFIPVVILWLGMGIAQQMSIAGAAAVTGKAKGFLGWAAKNLTGYNAAKWGVKDLNRKYGLRDLVSGDVVFSATGVTDGSMLKGVHRVGDYITTESVVMRSATGTVRWIKARHRRSV